MFGQQLRRRVATWTMWPMAMLIAGRTMLKLKDGETFQFYVCALFLKIYQTSNEIMWQSAVGALRIMWTVKKNITKLELNYVRYGWM